MPLVKLKKRTRSPPFPPFPTWTTSQFWSFVRSGLRSKFNRWPPKLEAKKEARREYTGPNKRLKFEYLCDECKQWHQEKNVEMDHIVPCGSLKNFSDLPGFLERIACSKEGFRCLCKPCHKLITKEQRSKKDDDCVGS